MTPRTLLALGAAVLALSAGTIVADSGPGATGDRAVAAEEHGVPIDSTTSTGTPTSTPSPTSAPTAGAPADHVSNAKLKRVDAIELGAESLVLRRGSKTVTTASMRDARTTVSLLNRLLGTPTRTQTAIGDGGACFPAGTTYTWGGAVRVAALTTPADAGNAVEIRVLKDSVRTRNGEDVELGGPDGVQVGDDIADRIADAPRSERVRFGTGAWQLLLQEGWEAEDAADAEEQDGTNGVSALTNDDVVTVLGSPMPVHAARTC